MLQGKESHANLVARRTMKLNKKQIVNALLGLSVTAILMTFMKKNFDELVFIVVLGVVVTGIIVINSED